MLAERMGRVSASPTMKVLVEADKLRQQGIDVVEFGAGEPDFPTPAHVKAAAHAAIDSNFTKYTPAAGTSELKQAICARYEADYGVTYKPNEVIVTAGGKQGLYNVALVLFGAGDEVITHAPCWPTLLEQVKLADATPVIVETHADDGFAIKADALLAAVTPATRGIIINSPCNPTGALMPESEMERLVDGLADRNIYVILDLCYEQLIYEPVPHNLPARAGQEVARQDDPVRVGQQVVRDDRVALRLGTGTGRGDCRQQRLAESLDLQRLLDLAEGHGGGAQRTGRHGDGHARGVPRPPRSAPRMAHGRSRVSRA